MQGSAPATPGRSTREEILRYALRNLDSPDLSVASIAGALHLSPRTVQRHFGDGDLTLSALIRRERLIRVRRDLAGLHVKILDFGIAKLTASGITVPGSIVGTLNYMSPEQLGSTKDAGVQSDIYALGCILYLMWTGEEAYPYDHVGEALTKKLGSLPSQRNIDDNLWDIFPTNDNQRAVTKLKLFQ